MDWQTWSSSDYSKIISEAKELVGFAPEEKRDGFLNELSGASELTTKTAETILAIAESLRNNGATALRCYNLSAELFHTLAPKAPSSQLRRAVMGYFAVWIPSQANYRAAEQVLAEVNDVATRLFGSRSPDLQLKLNTFLLDAYEHLRVTNAHDPELLKSLLTENYRTIRDLKVAVTHEAIKEEWTVECSHYAPELYQVVEAGRPQALSLKELFGAGLREKVANSKNARELYDCLVGSKDKLKGALLIRLEAPAKLEEPWRTLRLPGSQAGAHSAAELPEFVEAREKLRQGKHPALQLFRNIRREHATSALRQSIVDQWWAYAIATLGDKTDQIDSKQIFERVQPRDWTTEWNLACLEYMTGDPDKSFSLLLGLLETSHSLQVAEALLYIALVSSKSDFLLTSLPLCWYPEATILAFLMKFEKDPRLDFENESVQIDRIDDAPNWRAPHPYDKLSDDQLKQLKIDFSDRKIQDAGAEWFAVRLAKKAFAYSYLPWKLRAELLHEAGKNRDAIEPYQHSLERSLVNPTLHPNTKNRVLREVLYFCRDSKLNEEGLEILDKYGHDLALSSGEMAQWGERLGRKAPKRGPIPKPPVPPPVEEISPIPIKADVPASHKSASPPTPPPSAPVGVDWKNLNELVSRITSLKSFADLRAEKKSLAQVFELLERAFPTAWPSCSPTFSKILDTVSEFDAASDFATKATLGRNARSTINELRGIDIGSFKESEPYLKPIVESLGRLCNQLVIATETFPEPVIEALGRTNVFLSDELIGSSVLVRLENPASEPLNTINVALTSKDSAVEVLEPAKYWDVLPPNSSVILRYSIRRAEINESTMFRVTVSYSVGGTPHSMFKEFPIKTGSFARFVGKPSPYVIPERYVVSLPIATDQVKNFHGREEDQAKLVRSVEGGRLKKAVFINGIRRVGKTSLLSSLPRVMPSTVIPVLVDLRELDPGNRSNAVFLYHLARLIREKVDIHLGKGEVSCPLQTAFETNPPDVVFIDFMKAVEGALNGKRVLLLLDEIQYVAQSATEKKSSGVTDTILNMLAAQCKPDGPFLLMLTASVLYTDIRMKYPHTLWGMVVPQDISFVSDDAAKKILQNPVEEDKVTYTEEALRRAWEITHGHPWITQAIGSEALEILNRQQRVVVAPEDVEDAFENLVKLDTYAIHWWNEQFMDHWDQELALILLDEKKTFRHSLPIAEFQILLQKKGIPSADQRLAKLCRLEILEVDRQGGIGFKGQFLERWLQLQPRVRRQPPSEVGFGIFVDWDNLFHPLRQYVESLPKEVKRLPFESRITAKYVAARLLQYASKRGTKKRAWAVANWPNVGRYDVSHFREGGFRIDQGEGKDPTDNCLKEHIRDALEFAPDVGLYILVFGDGDYLANARTILERGKKVLIWSCKDTLSGAYRRLLDVEIEYVEDILFEDKAAVEPRSATA